MKSLHLVIKYLLVAGIIGIALSSFSFSHAQVEQNKTTMRLQVPIPGSGGGEVAVCERANPDAPYLCDGISKYIVLIYKWIMGFAAILAMLAFVYAGILWMNARGDSGMVGEAKKVMINAIVGLVLTLGSYTLLWAINPRLVKMKSLQLMGVDPLDISFLPGEEPFQDVQNGETKGMECFFSTFGRSQQEVESQLVSVQILNFTFRIHKKAQAAYEKVNRELIAAGVNYTIVPTGGTGGFNWRRNVNNASEISPHAFGIAIDINPGSVNVYPPRGPNPNYAKPGRRRCPAASMCPLPCMTDLPNKLVQVFMNNGFRWGGAFKNTCDSMHFDWIELCKK